MAFIPSSEEHGGIDPSELEQYALSPEQLIDFSVNINPFGPSPRVREALARVDISRYPDRNCLELRHRLAELNDTALQEILVGNGTAELIWLIARALLKPGDHVLIVGPVFGEYRRAAEQAGATLTEIRAEPPDFQPPLAAAIAAIAQNPPRLVFLCNPNNPSGNYIQSEQVQRLTAACGPETILVYDEAYRDFVAGLSFGPAPARNSLALRSMTKDFALAGLRLGYVLGDAGLLAQLRANQPAWSVSGPAQAAGLAALSDLDYYRQTLAMLKLVSADFHAELQNLGYSLVPSDVHFTLVRLDYPARDLRARLLPSAIQVRDCASFGLPDYVRISTRLPRDNQRLLMALASLTREDYR